MSDIYRIGIKIALTGGASAAIAALGKELSGVGVKADQLTGKFGRMQLAIAGAFGGVAIAGITAFVKKTADLSHELAQIQKLGNQSANDLRRITGSAVGVTRTVAGINEKQALDIYASVYSLVGKRDALKLMKPLAKFDVFMGNTTGDFGAAMSGSRDLVRAAEQMGRLTNPKTGDVDLGRFSHFLDFATKVASITHGQVGSKEWLQMAKMGGPALMGMSDQSLATMAILSQYMGSGRTGTAMMSTMQQFAGGTMYARNAQALQDVGVLHQGEWSTKGGGGRVILSPEARARLAKEFQQPLNAVLADLIPKLKGAGYDTPDKMIQELFAIFSRSTTQRAFADLVRNEQQIIRELGRISKAPGLDQSLSIANDQDVSQNLKNLGAAWTNLEYAIAGPNSENEIWAIKELTAGINKFSDAVRGMDPDTLREISVGFAGLAVGLTGAGALALLSALGPAGWFVAGMGALVGLNWAGMGTPFQKFVHSVEALFNVIQHPLSGWAWEGKDGPNGKLPSWAQPGPVDPKTKKSRDDNTKALQDLNDSFRQFKYFDPTLFVPGGGGGPRVIPALYTGGGLGNGVDYSGGFGAPTYSVPSRGSRYGLPGGGHRRPARDGDLAASGAPAYGLPGGARAPFSGYHWTTTDVWKGIGGKASDLAGPDLSGLHGNAYIKASRSSFAKELSDPQKRLQFAAMLLSEGNPLQTAESAMNRSNFQRKSLMRTLHSGFYGPINRGQLPSFMRRLQNNPKLMAKMDAAINSALAGSDTIKGSTDQGMVSDPNGGYILRHFHVWGKGHGNIYGDWNGGRGTKAWREQFEAHANASGPSDAIAHFRHEQAIIHSHVHLDGKQIAQSTAKHLVQQGNMPQQGARLPDYIGTRRYGI